MLLQWGVKYVRVILSRSHNYNIIQLVFCSHTYSHTHIHFNIYIYTACSSCDRGCYYKENNWWEWDECKACPSGTYMPHNGHTNRNCYGLSTCYSPDQYVDNGNQGSSTSNRVCRSCAYGTQSNSNNQLSCQIDINGCTVYNGNTLCKDGGDSSAGCNDVTASQSSSTNQYTCSCSLGYHVQGGECVDVQSCQGNSCTLSGDVNAVCQDLVAPKYVIFFLLTWISNHEHTHTHTHTQRGLYMFLHVRILVRRRGLCKHRWMFKQSLRRLWRFNSNMFRCISSLNWQYMYVLVIRERIFHTHTHTHTHRSVQHWV